jgi:hypothetical protein
MAKVAIDPAKHVGSAKADVASFENEAKPGRTKRTRTGANG